MDYFKKKNVQDYSKTMYKICIALYSKAMSPGLFSLRCMLITDISTHNAWFVTHLFISTVKLNVTCNKMYN